MVRENFTMNVEAVGTEDGNRTYEIRRSWSDEGKKSLVIELYPTLSVNECGKLDLSTMHLLNHVAELGWAEMRIVNLYSTIFDKKPLVSQLTEDSDNLSYIEEILEEADIADYDIVIAWGNSLASHTMTINAKIDLLNMIKDKGLEKNTKCIVTDTLCTIGSYGVHPLYLGLHYSKDVWDLIDYPINEILKELTNSIKAEKSKEVKSKKGVKKSVSKNKE